MDIGLYATTHGFGYRDEVNFLARSISAEDMQPVQTAQLAERLGYHSMWFPDHVCMPMASTSAHVANASGTRAYESRHTMLDAAVVMGAVAVSTSRLKLGTSVLIAPYRNPLSDARQFATIDQLSGGRLLFGVGAGWMQEEFDALGLEYAKRAAQTEECIEVYKRAWADEAVGFQGQFYSFDAVSMDPKPVQRPTPPIIYGGVTVAGARRAARLCNGFYPIFLDSHAEPSRYAKAQEVIRRELEGQRKDPAEFAMIGVSSARLTAADDPKVVDLNQSVRKRRSTTFQARANPRRICTGTPDQILTDLERFARAGYSLIVCFFDCPSGQRQELEEQMQQFSEQVLPQAAGIVAQGGWKAQV